MATNQKGLKKRKNLIIPLVAILVLAGAAGAYIYFSKNAQATAAVATATEAYYTAQVRQGDLTVSASGTGTLTAGKTTNLSFPVSGEVSAVNVQVGDDVTTGTVLAELADTGSLRNSVISAELDLKTAQKALDDLTTNAGSNVATAQLAVVEAKQAYEAAAEVVHKAGDVRCDEDTIDAYYSDYLDANNVLQGLKADPYDQAYYLKVIAPAEENVKTAYNTYLYCLNYTQYEIDSSQANVTIAESTLKQAEAELEVILANNGVDPDEYALAENTVENAQLTYDKAQKNLESAKMTAPFDGTITVVNGETGDVADTGTFITIADLQHPLVSFSIDETDIDKAAIGSAATVVFDAMPDLTFSGTVTQLNPSLTSSGGYSVLEGTIKLNLDDQTSVKRLVEGLSGSVEIISGEAKGALLVPVEALRDLGDGTYSVFVVGEDGKPRLKVVEVGIMDVTYAEIKSGLSLGDVVTTGAMETN